ncbi:pimeloyl-ACP methyl ester carboxylesterase [Kribbella amoyensis]|uniref:Pimeloyl-ACP methyl ester carboxylesterase n=1 Tax=Kribbella amoyensis TaxID=996641 RepID=A0A561BM97_9ACTN|nr:alpha/beta hydrolase [Kribbella amoyensis]TWD80001.1 pimeloyl-ACP methyl ester carboxylesterase [Kribbella amoyensis]
MPTFTTSDGTTLAYHLLGQGEPLICLPGGPMRDSAYLGDLGGLGEHRQLDLLDLRGTGQSAVPEDATSYRCDRLVDDVEALREHLGLDQLDLLAHSAGANLAALYLTRHPDRVRKLALITPSVFAVDLQVTGDHRLEVARLREGEPWYPAAFAALERITQGQATDDDWQAIDPFRWGRWDEAAQAHEAANATQRNNEAAAIFGSAGAYDPPTTRAALAAFTNPVLLLAGEVDLAAPPAVVDEYAALFPSATRTTQPQAGHCPWLDDPQAFTKTTATFLA